MSCLQGQTLWKTSKVNQISVMLAFIGLSPRVDAYLSRTPPLEVLTRETASKGAGVCLTVPLSFLYITGQTLQSSWFFNTLIYKIRRRKETIIPGVKVIQLLSPFSMNVTLKKCRFYLFRFLDCQMKLWSIDKLKQGLWCTIWLC